jgi:ElaA protein
MLRVARFAQLDTVTLYRVLRLRLEVFVVEQACAYPELDGRDVEPDTLHLWLDHDGAPIAYLRLLAEPDGTRRIGRVCTAKEHRGSGLAARLVADALRIAGGRPCVLESQSYLVGFYQRFGFAVTGAEYVEDGIAHVPMRQATGD